MDLELIYLCIIILLASMYVGIILILNYRHKKQEQAFRDALLQERICRLEAIRLLEKYGVIVKGYKDLENQIAEMIDKSDFKIEFE